MGGRYAAYEVADSQPTFSAMRDAIERLDETEVGNFLSGNYRHFFTDSEKRYPAEAWADAWAYGYVQNGTSIEAAAFEMYEFAAEGGFGADLSTNPMQMGALAAEIGRRSGVSPAAGVIGLWQPFEEYCHGLGTNLPRAPWMAQNPAEMTVFCSILIEVRKTGHPLDRLDGEHRTSVLESLSVYEYATRVLCLAWPAAPREHLSQFAGLLAEWTGRENPLNLIWAYRDGMTLDELEEFIQDDVAPEYGLLTYGLTL